MQNIIVTMWRLCCYRSGVWRDDSNEILLYLKTDSDQLRAINLGKRMWNIRNGQHKYDQVLWPSVLAKLSAVIIPGILMGIVQLDYVLEHRTLLVILGNVCCQ